MNIFINDKPADIILDTEKNLGDVLAGIEQWISPLGNRIMGISINGNPIEGDGLCGEFGRGLSEINKLDISVSSWSELAAEALEYLHETCALYADASFDKRAQIVLDWENSAAARFLYSDISDFHSLAKRSFSGEGLPAAELAVLARERLREISSPGQEIAVIEELVHNIALRMEELPLDIQTGKDKRAAETLQFFSGMGEKLFRIFFIMKSEGLSLDTFEIDSCPARTFIEEFHAALNEIHAAYENRDTVLVGDIAEYELSPRLLKFFSAIKIKLGSPVVSSS